MNGHLIAVIADSLTGEERDPTVQPLVLAAVTAILEHGGRVLLSADAAVRLPVLLAAAEYIAPIEVETPSQRPAAPIILSPFPDDDSLEEKLFTEREPSDDDRMEGASRTLLSELIHMGIAEEPANEGINDPQRSFDSLLRTLEPAAVLMIGSSERAVSLRDAAMRYRHDVERSKLVRLDRSQLTRDWQSIDDRMESFRLPPRFDGQSIEDLAGSSDGLLSIATHAADDAARVLAIEDVVAEILGDLESIAPSRPKR